MTQELAPQTPEVEVAKPEPKKMSIAALVSLLGGILTYLWLPIVSILDISKWLPIVLAPLSALVAVIAGGQAKRNIRKSEGQMSGKKMANWGLWLGWIFIVGTILFIVLGFTLLGGLITWIKGLLG
jgi:hypothetical protein